MKICIYMYNIYCCLLAGAYSFYYLRVPLCSLFLVFWICCFPAPIPMFRHLSVPVSMLHRLYITNQCTCLVTLLANFLLHKMSYLKDNFVAILVFTCRCFKFFHYLDN